jgi:hypothetical protein
MNKKCPLCETQSDDFFQDTQKYYKCINCHSIFVDENDLPDGESEKKRYEMHENDPSDKGYRKFVSPITSSILNDFKKDHVGLDFGAGTGAVICEVLKEQGYNIFAYDPYFYPNKELLNVKYDYIASSEVIEHFYHPKKEFEMLKGMLKDGGKLYLMTDIYDESIDFASWYYKNDPTHVFLYHKDAFEYIREKFEFKSVKVKGRLIVFSN